MPRIGSFGLSRRTKYKLELNHVIRVAVNKHVFGETKFTYLRVTSTCSQKKSAGRNKTQQNRRQGIKLPLETIAFYSDSFVTRKIKRWTKSGRELGPAENWAPHCMFHHCGVQLHFLCHARLFLCKSKHQWIPGENFRSLSACLHQLSENNNNWP